MSKRSLVGLELGEWVLRQRWWLVLVASLIVLVYEMYEYQPHVNGIRERFLFEIFFYGTLLPISTGLALSHLAASRAELARSLYHKNLRRNLRLQLSDAETRSEIANVILQFIRLLMPLMGFSLYFYNRRAQTYEPVMHWTLKKDHERNEMAFGCGAKSCPLAEYCLVEEKTSPAKAGGASRAINGSANGLAVSRKSELQSCMTDETGPGRTNTNVYCMPVLLAGSPVAGVQLYFPSRSNPTAEQAALLNEISPDIASAIEHFQLEDLVHTQSESLSTHQQRIARDVHDTLGHSLAYMGFKLDLITMEINRAELDALRREIESIRDVAKEAYDQMRTVLDSLTLSEDSNLRNNLLGYLGKIRPRVNFDLQVHCRGQQWSPAAPIQRNILFILQEALTNIEKHARARHVDVALNWEEATLEIVVRDDGVGFDPVLAQSNGHFGLRNMQDRIRECGGWFEVSSQKESGTEIKLIVPREQL